MRPSGHTFDLIVLAADGSPMPSGDLSEAMVLDMESMPAFEQRAEVTDGRVRLPAPDGPFGISIPLPVPGFGHVWIYADNNGEGYRPSDIAGKPLNFCLEAARSRAAAVANAEQQYRAAGTRPSSDYSDRLANANNLLADAVRKSADDIAASKLAIASLAHSMHAGEILVVEHARARIARAPKRPNFRFGCHGFKYPALSEPYAQLFGSLLNFVTLPFYRARTEQQEGKRDFSQIEKILEWTTRDGLGVKGHPLLWFSSSGVPKWMAGHSYAQMEVTHRSYILEAVGRFRDRVGIWDIVNEMHDWQNILGYSPEQLVEMTRLAADTTREADPNAVRIVNSCGTWSEYVATGRSFSGPIGRPGVSVLQYLRNVMAAGVGFEVIGLQMYYPARDLFEIDRQLERFCKLGKPVHITELGVSSSTAPVEHHPITDVHANRYWHGEPWSESIQADWAEAYYTICYAKPALQAITWWDFCDPSFIPHGGFVDDHLRPKESYRRLQRLLQSWR